MVPVTLRMPICKNVLADIGGYLPGFFVDRPQAKKVNGSGIALAAISPSETEMDDSAKRIRAIARETHH